MNDATRPAPEAAARGELPPAPAVSLVVVCRNRLAHLQQTLAQMLAQSDAEVIVVDYGCSQGTQDWLHRHHPAVRTVRVADDPGFSLSRARNLGAAAARGRLLLFVDADVHLQFDLAAWGVAHAQAGSFYTLDHRRDPSLCGTVLLAGEDFRRAGGYDEVFRSWGWEDADLYFRLQQLGLRRRYLPERLARSIPHDDRLRQIGGRQRSKRTAMLVGRLSTQAKRDYWRANGRTMPQARRTELMQRLWQAAELVASGEREEVELRIQLRQERGAGHAGELLLRYRILARHLAPAAAGA